MRKNIRCVALLLTMLLTTVVCVACGSDSTSTNSTENVKENKVVNNDFEDASSEILNANEVGNTIGNIASGGWLAKQDDWIYYNNGKGLYRIKTDGTERMQLCLDDAREINIIGESVYFVNNSGLKKINSNGEVETYIDPSDPAEREQEIEIYLDNSAENVIVVGDWIYYITGREGASQYNWYLHKIKIDGTEKQLLCNLEHGANSINVVGDWIYFAYGKGLEIEDIGIYKIKTDGTMLQQISNNVTSEIIVMDDYIYFYNSYTWHDEGAGLYRMKTDGTEKQRLFAPTEEEMFGFSDTIYNAGDYIFFYHEGYVDGKNIITWYKIKTDGTELQEVVELADTEKINGRVNVAIFDDYIYFKTDMGIYQMKADGTERMQLE